MLQVIARVIGYSPSPAGKTPFLKTLLTHIKKTGRNKVGGQLEVSPQLTNIHGAEGYFAYDQRKDFVINITLK